MTCYAKPTTVDEALALLARADWRPLAGATHFYPAQGVNPIRENVMDINGLSELRGISETAENIVIGARTTWMDLQCANLPPALDALKQAAREVGSVQIQNAATVAGNLCNASPAADGVPVLLTLGAEVELRSARETRCLPLPGFILGNRRTARQADELVTAIRIPKHSMRGTSAFFKLGARRYLVISIAMAAVRIVADSKHVESAAVAVGACSAVAQRLTRLETALAGRRIDEVVEIIAQTELPELAPIDDVRGSAGYRMAAAREIVLRACNAALSAGGRRAA